MKRSLDVFLSVNDHRLFMDMVFAEYHYPILFTCVDESGAMYIATCFHADAREKKWLIAKTSPESIISLLCNNIPIRDVFPKGDRSVYLITKSRGTDEPYVKEMASSNVPDEYFPSPEMFMDADDDEFLEDLAILKKRVLSKQRQKQTIPFSDERQAGQFSMQIWVGRCLPKINVSKDTAFNTITCWTRRAMYESV